MKIRAARLGLGVVHLRRMPMLFLSSPSLFLWIRWVGIELPEKLTDSEVTLKNGDSLSDAKHEREVNRN
jgi:hypothetical protein